MRIISNFKDYYDFAAGHDTDPRKVFVRREEIHASYKVGSKSPFLKHIVDLSGFMDKKYESNWRGVFKGIIWFCDVYTFYVKDTRSGNIYFSYDQIPREVSRPFDYTRRFWRSSSNIGWKGQKQKTFNYLEDVFLQDAPQHWMYKPQPNYLEKPLNRLYGQPIIFSRLAGDRETEQVVINGNLESVGFNRHMNPQEAYTALYNWIPYNEPEMPSDPTDMNRFENKGFDKKISFRNVK